MLTRGESRIHIKAAGVGYEFCTMDENFRYYLYKNGKNLGEFSSHCFSDDPYTVKPLRQGDQTWYTLTLRSGEKFGPYETVSPVYDYRTYEITGIRYKDKGKHYLKNLDNGKTYGPYDDFITSRLTKEEMTISYKETKGWYLLHNDVLYGPYRNLNSPYAYRTSKNEKFYFHFQDDQDQWHTYYDQAVLPYSSGVSPGITAFDNGKLMFRSSNSDRYADTAYYHIDDRKYRVINFVEEIDHNSFGDILESKLESRSYTSVAKVYDDGKEIGRFTRQYINENNCSNSPYFQCLFTDPDSKEVFIYGNKQLTRLGTEDEVHNHKVYLVGNDYYFIRQTDNVLLKNGQATERDVLSFDCSNPNEIILQKRQGDYDVLYRNGKEMSYGELAKYKHNPQWYTLKDSPMQFYEIDGKTYIQAKGSNKKIGPVRRYNEFRFSRGNAHLAECDNRRMEIFIDNKLFSPGFSLAFHEKENSFYWLSIEGNKLYLHSYQND